MNCSNSKSNICSSQINLKKVCYEIPKAETHIHIEGSLTPEFGFELVTRNKIDKTQFPHQTFEEIKSYMFSYKNLEEFMDIYHHINKLLVTELDFEELVYNYIKKAAEQGTVYTEIFFDPQHHTSRGISFETVFQGVTKGLERGKREHNVESQLILGIIADHSLESCFETLNQALPYKDQIIGVSLDCSPHNEPEKNFVEFMKLAKSQGYKLMAHCGLEGDVSCFRPTFDNLKLDRIDHGYLVMQDKDFLDYCRDNQVPFTACPATNNFLEYPDLIDYPLRDMLEYGLLVSVHSDDPALVGYFIGDNYWLIVEKNNFTFEELVKIAQNSFKGSFLEEERKAEYLRKLDDYVNSVKSG